MPLRKYQKNGKADSKENMLQDILCTEKQETATRWEAVRTREGDLGGAGKVLEYKSNRVFA